MKNLFVLFINYVLASPLFAQTVCLSPAEYATRQKQLDRNYASADELFPGHHERTYVQFGGFYAIGPDERKLILAGQQFRAAFEKQFKSLPSLQNSNLTFQLRLYVRGDGTIDQVAYEFMQNQFVGKPTAEQAADFEKQLCQWLASYRYPFTAPRPYRTNSILALGQSRMGSKSIAKKGTLTTLEAAGQTAQPDTVRIIRWTMMELTRVPEVLYRFKNVEDLDLSGNELTDIPAAVWAFPRLKRLNLMGNRIKPENLAQIPKNTHLDFLNLQYNQLTTIPTALANNRRLTSLWLGHNNLSAGLNTGPLRRLRRLQDLNLYNAHLATLPASIGRLKKLQILDLYYNNLRGLPPQIGRLRRLQQLAIAHNKLNTLPTRLGKLRRLEKLYGHHNYLASLPTSLPHLKRLQVLDINHNAFGRVPDELFRLPALEELDLSNNHLTDVPAGFAQLPNLKKLFLRGNPVSTEKRVSAQLPVIQRLESQQTEVFY